MIKKADFNEKRILTVNADYGHRYRLSLLNDNIRFTKDDVVINQLSYHLVFAVFIIGDISITTSLLKKLSSFGIPVYFLNHNLSVKAATSIESEGNYLLRVKQYESKSQLSVSKNIVINKIRSQESILRKAKKHYDKNIFISTILKLDEVNNSQQLLGVEGNISREYFQTLFKDIGWIRRAPQTKEDITNLLLDIGYTYLFNYCDALLRLFGFDTYKGYYHQLFFQRKSLVCDVIEPMRPMIDYKILKSYNLGQIKEPDFVYVNGHYDFRNGYKTSKEYSLLFFEEISENKDKIYNYIYQFYKYCMDSNKNKYIFYEI